MSDPNVTSPAHWAVTVSRSGEEIVTIESNCLSGRDISPEDEATIRTAAEHLLALVGPKRREPTEWVSREPERRTDRKGAADVARMYPRTERRNHRRPDRRKA